jgi:23S rRNA (guanosine2251-2'-O)-methyltransferase
MTKQHSPKPETGSHPRTDHQWIWGRRPVLEAARAGKAQLILVSTSLHDPSFLDSIREAAGDRARVEIVDRARIDAVVRGQLHQGVAAQIEQLPMSTPEEILAAVERDTKPALLLVLDQIQDPRNLGSLIRTAEAAGVQGVITTERNSAPLTGVVEKASAGAISHVPIAPARNLSRLLTLLQAKGIWTLGLDGDAERTIYETDLTVPLAIVVGSEGRGIRRLTEERVDMLAKIPMFGRVPNLNASVAGGIALFEAVRQRHVR